MYKFRNMLLTSVLGLSITGGAVYALQNKETVLNFDAINASIKAATDDIVSAYEGLTTYQYSLIPEGTDIDQNTYKVALNLGVAAAPWSTEAVTADATIGYSVVTEGEEKGTTISLQADVNTDPLKLVQYILKVGVACPVPETVQGLKRVIAKRNCADREALQDVESIAEMERFVKRRIHNLKSAIGSYIHRLDDELDDARGNVRSLLRSELKASRRVLRALRNAEVESAEGGFSVTLPEISANDMLILSDVKTTVKTGKISFEWTAKTPLGTTLYDAGKPEVLHILRGLEQGESFATELIKIESRFYANLLQKLPAK